MPSDKGKKQTKVKPEGADGHRQRMITKFIGSYKNGFYSRDIVEMLLYYSIKVQDTRDTAVRLMDDNDDNIYSILDADKSKLCRTKGIGPVSAALLRTVGAIVNRNMHGKSSANSSSSYSAEKMYTFDNILDIITSGGEEKIYIAYHQKKQIIYELLSTEINTPDYLTDVLKDLIKQSCINHSCGITILRYSKTSIASTPQDVALIYDVDKLLAESEVLLFGYYIVKDNRIIDLKSSFIQ